MAVIIPGDHGQSALGCQASLLVELELEHALEGATAASLQMEGYFVQANQRRENTVI